MTVLSVKNEFYTVKGFDGSMWLAHRDELETKARSKEEDDEV